MPLFLVELCSTLRRVAYFVCFGSFGSFGSGATTATTAEARVYAYFVQQPGFLASVAEQPKGSKRSKNE